MPASPEVGDGLGDIGIVEVFEELKAEHIAQTARHVGVAREVEIDLEGIGGDADPCSEHAVLVGMPEHRGGERAHLVGDEHLLSQTDAEQLHALCEAVEGLFAVVELIGYVAVADDGTRDQLRKQRDVGAEVDEALRDGRVVAVDVDDVGHRLEGVERDADGQ